VELELTFTLRYLLQAVSINKTNL